MEKEEQSTITARWLPEATIVRFVKLLFICYVQYNVSPTEFYLYESEPEMFYFFHNLSSS